MLDVSYIDACLVSFGMIRDTAFCFRIGIEGGKGGREREGSNPRISHSHPPVG